MFDVISKILALLSPKEKKQAYLILGMVLVMAFLDVVGIASIMPFMAVLANPEVIETNQWLNRIYVGLEFSNPQGFLFFLGVVVFMALVISISFKAATTWMTTHFTQMREYSIGRRLVAGYLSQPYAWFLNRHSAELGKAVLSEVQLVVANALVPMMRLLAHGAVVIAILLLLLAVDPMLALMVAGAMGGAYILIYVSLRNLLKRIGKDRVEANELRFKVVNEAFGGIKEVKLGGLEQAALHRFDGGAKRFARAQMTAQIAGLMPRFALEIFAFGGILALVLFLMGRGDGLQSVLPIIALYALAGYRLLPALQTVFDQATKLRYSGAGLDRLHEDLTKHQIDPVEEEPLQVVFPRHSLGLSDVTYTYPNAGQPALKSIGIEIPAQCTVGLVGKTGSGKTTAVDIILGLLQPQSGTMFVDDEAITPLNCKAWQKSLGYVPQHIFLVDETVAANIAFGVPSEDIDREAVERAARVANLHRFIVDELPEGYDTIVGERGVRLSGGQRQRIGIARALYNNPKVLVLDEATSALDNLTEQAVMDAVHNLSGEITIILIAHRLSTVRECDRIFVLEQGQLVGEGTYDELKASNERFRAMAGG